MRQHTGSAGHQGITTTDMNQKPSTTRIKNILLLQGAVAVYSLTTICARFASAEKLLSPRFILFFGLEIVVLGIYAILWQQILKVFDVSIAYCNRAAYLLWGILWSLTLFRESVGIKQLLGVAVVIAGVVILNLPGEEENSSDKLDIIEEDAEEKEADA